MSGPYYYGQGHPIPSAMSYPQQPGNMPMPGYGYPPTGFPGGYPGAYPYPRPGYPPPMSGYPPHPGYQPYPGYPPQPGYPPTGNQVMVAPPPSAPRETEVVELPHKPYKWVPCSTLHMVLPPDALMAGVDGDGQPLFAGRSYHNGNFLPAKVNPEKKTCHVSFEGEEIAKDAFEVLVPLTLRWRFAADGDVPEGAVESGTTVDGETLYVGRVQVDETKLPGKVQKSQGVCYYSLAGEEIGSAEYEVLVFV